MFTDCQKKQQEIRDLFNACNAEEEKYEKIIELGRAIPPMDNSYKTQDNIVKGCQSVMYLRSYLLEGVLFFEVDSEALISKGLAAILLRVYNGEKPEVILTSPPDYLSDIGISNRLTPNRANGLYSIHLKMKQDALKWLMHQKKGS